MSSRSEQPIEAATERCRDRRTTRVKPDDGFQLAHFHSNVQYDAAGFINKNQDALSANLSLVVERQAAKLWRELVADARRLWRCRR